MIGNAPRHLRGIVYWEPITTPDFGYTMGALKQYKANQYMANEGMKAFREENSQSVMMNLRHSS